MFKIYSTASSLKFINLNTNLLSKSKLSPIISIPFLKSSTNTVSATSASAKTKTIETKNASSIDQQNQISSSSKEILKNINTQIENQSEGRLFAVVQLLGKQFKITAGDIILVEGNWPPTIGDRIRLDKILLAGNKDFTLIGRPLLQRNLIDIQATIIEKTLTHTRTHFIKHKRKQYMRINFYRSQNTMIRINSIEIKGKINETNSNNDENSLRLF